MCQPSVREIVFISIIIRMLNNSLSDVTHAVIEQRNLKASLIVDSNDVAVQGSTCRFKASKVTRLVAFVLFHIQFIKVFLRLFSTETLSYYSFTSKPSYVLVFAFLAAAIRFTLENA